MRMALPPGLMRGKRRAMQNAGNLAKIRPRRAQPRREADRTVVVTRSAAPKESLLEEFAGGCGDGPPTLPQQEIVDVVRDHDFLDAHAALQQTLLQVDGLMELHLAIVLPLHQKH